MTTHAERADLITEALAHAMGDNDEAVAETLTRISEDATSVDMYAVCLCFADAAKTALEALNGRKVADGMAILQDRRPPGSPDAPPHELFALRFVVAHMNGDRDTTRALFMASARAAMEEHCDSICTLLLYTGRWLKNLYDKHTAGVIDMTPWDVEAD